MEYLLSNYGYDSLVTYWIDNLEIFIVPMLNPDGWKYVVDDSLTNPWWKKNQCDNDSNGVFQPSYDGVDLNRNYAFNWALGGSGYPWHIRYRGTHPFSESESVAKRNLAFEQKFVLSLTYHSGGATEHVAVTNDYSGYAPPDLLLMIELADSISRRIPKFYSSGHYGVIAVDCYGGFSDCWMYASNGDLEFTIETSPEYMSPGPNALQIAQNNIPGALYLLERVTNGPGISGIITDSATTEPLSARIKILELELPHHEGIIEPRISDSLSGRFYRLLQPGFYTVEISKETYYTKIIDSVEIVNGEWTLFDVPLKQKPTFADQDQIDFSLYYALEQNYPNPFNPTTTIKYQIPEQSFFTLKVYDVLGNEIACLVNEKKSVGSYEVKFDATELPSGIYFYRMQAGNYADTKKMVLLK